MNGELIDVAIKSDEYCFLWIDWWATCLTKSEWASWAQVIGVFVAIISSCVVMLWQLNIQEKQKIYENENNYKNSKANIKCVLEDELEYITGNLKKFDRYFFEETGLPKPYGKYLFTPRELKPFLIEKTLEEYYSRFNANERLGFKSVFKLVEVLNDISENAKKFRQEKEFDKELQLVHSYIKTGCVYRYLLLRLLANEDVPTSPVDDKTHIKEMCENLNLSYRLNYI